VPGAGGDVPVGVVLGTSEVGPKASGGAAGAEGRCGIGLELKARGATAVGAPATSISAAAWLGSDAAPAGTETITVPFGP
jgi:hypothetical protein